MEGRAALEKARKRKLLGKVLRKASLEGRRRGTVNLSWVIQNSTQMQTF